MAAHTFTYTFDEAFVRAALRRDVLWRGVYASAALLVVLGLTWLWAGRLGVLEVAIVLIALVLLWAILLRQLRSGAARLVELWTKQAPDRAMTFRLDDDGFDVVLGASSSRHTWKGMRRLWRYPDVWILEIVKNLSVFFPPDEASDEVRAYIVERCRANEVRL